MFRIRIYEQEQKIQIEGEVSLIREIHQSMEGCDFLSDYSEYKNVDTNGTKTDCALLRFGIWNFKTLIKGQPIIQIFINFINNHNIFIDDRTRYFLDYWRIEVRMMETKQSYRSHFDSAVRELTLSMTLNTVLDLCKNQFPPAETLFKFLENSQAMKGNTASSRPLTPTISEIKDFLITNQIPLKPAQRRIATDLVGNIMGYRLFSGVQSPHDTRLEHARTQVPHSNDRVSTRKKRV